MGLGVKTDYIIESNQYVTLTGLKKVSDDSDVDNATVKGYICKAPQNPDAGEPADLGTGGEVGIKITGHGMLSGDLVFLTMMVNYNGYYVLTANTTTDKIFITSAQTAETFIGNEDVYEVVENGAEITLTAAGSGGNYSGSFDADLTLDVGTDYYRITKVDVPSTLEQRLFVDKVTGVYG